uniref:Uncharacterized protein n=1 Tax=Rhizophora mucronata TaxID=61149 RepID=A0A2P2NV90_RHIMU
MLDHPFERKSQASKIEEQRDTRSFVSFYCALQQCGSSFDSQSPLCSFYSWIAVSLHDRKAIDH